MFVWGDWGRGGIFSHGLARIRRHTYSRQGKLAHGFLFWDYLFFISFTVLTYLSKDVPGLPIILQFPWQTVTCV